MNDEFCGPQGVVVPDDEYPIPEGPAWWAALTGITLGTLVGWWIGSSLREPQPARAR